MDAPAGSGLSSPEGCRLLHQGRGLLPVPILGTDQVATSWPQRACDALAAVELLARSAMPLPDADLRRITSDLADACAHLRDALDALAARGDAGGSTPSPGDGVGAADMTGRLRRAAEAVDAASRDLGAAS